MDDYGGGGGGGGAKGILHPLKLLGAGPLPPPPPPPSSYAYDIIHQVILSNKTKGILSTILSFSVSRVQHASRHFFS